MANEYPSVVESRFDNLFKAIITGGWAQMSSGDVESPYGHFAFIPIDKADRVEFVEAFVLEFPEMNELRAGNYIAVENDQGVITVTDYGTHPQAYWEARTEYHRLYAEYINWSFLDISVIDEPVTPEWRIACLSCGEGWDDLTIAKAHENVGDSACGEGAYEIVEA